LRSTGKNMKDKLVLNRVRNKTNLQFFLLKIPVDFRNPLPFRRLPAQPPRLAGAVSRLASNSAGVSQILQSIKEFKKNMKDKLVLNRVRNKTNLQLFLLKIPVDFRNPLPFRRLPASLLDASVCGVSASQ
ncbi:hypothetical protein AB1L16_24905, partial [Peribacillus frigoritolerans]|uniref:hypothetical protein n=1 Tax=Peribacillus frigoritolerans TaxID=450367 RepID=UPI0039A22CF5